MARGSVILAAFFVVAPAMAGDTVPRELKICRGERDERARLACFDAAMVKLEAAPSNFGGEALPQPDASPQEPAVLAARTARVSYNAIHHFTLTLDNGQVWRQLESDTAVARFGEGAAVRIKRGFMDSYSLSVEGAFGSYKVKRIK